MSLRKQLREEYLADTTNREKKEQQKEAAKLAKKTYRRKRREAVDILLRELEEDRREGRMRDQFQKIKTMKNGYQPRSELIKNEEGRILSGEDEDKETIKLYLIRC